MTFADLCAACATVGKTVTGDDNEVIVMWGIPERSWPQGDTAGKKWIASFGTVKASARKPQEAVSILAGILFQKLHEEKRRRDDAVKDVDSRIKTARAIAAAIESVYSQVIDDR